MGCLNAKTALVTGGARGIGAAIVRRLAAEGAEVAFAYRGAQDAAEALVAEIEAGGGKALAIKADVSTAQGVAAAEGVHKDERLKAKEALARLGFSLGFAEYGRGRPCRKWI